MAGQPPPPKFQEDLKALNDDTQKEEPASAGNGNGDQNKSFAPPPPKFDAPAPRRQASDAVKAAAAAAARAAQHATPAQRERLVMEAAASALAAHEDRVQAEAAGAARGPRPAPGVYQPPDWEGTFQGISYGMEVMKTGTIVGTIDLSTKGHFTFGRTPDNDIILDHPSSSRLHAVVQYRGEDGASFLYDPGSTHGVFLNKKRIPPVKYIPLRVGDMLKFGESTRTYVFTGPSELMPEEGPSREHKKQAALLEAIKSRKEKEAAIAKAQMAKALTGGVSWGMDDDGNAVDEDQDDLEHLDWRAYAQTKGLSEKQQKLADKIRKRERRIENLQRESEKIRAKETKMEELSAGQASTLVRNEQEIDAAMAEMEELEEHLIDSIRDSIGQKRKQSAGKDGAKQQRKKRRRDSDDEYLGSDDDDDDDNFYDRTTAGAGGASRKTRQGKGGKKNGNAPVAEDAASLYGKKEALVEERKKVEAKLRLEEETQAKLKQQPPAAALGDKNKEAAAQQGDDDSLDAFMSNVDAQLETDKVVSLKKELSELDSQIQQCERLLKIADPEGYFKPGSKAAELAVQRAKRTMDAEKKKKEAEEKQKELVKLKQAEEEAKMAAALNFQDDQDDEVVVQEIEQVEEKKPVAENINRVEADVGNVAGGLEVRTRPPPAALENQSQEGEKKPSSMGSEQHVSSYEARRKHIAAALASQKGGGAGIQQQQEEKPPQDAAASKVLADLEVLKQARLRAEAFQQKAGQEEEEREMTEEEVAAWMKKREAQGQAGDGKTKLNDMLGY